MCSACAFLENLVPSNGAKGRPKKRQQKPKPTATQSDPAVENVEKLSRVLDDIKKDPGSLVKRLEAFLVQVKAPSPANVSKPPPSKPVSKESIALTCLNKVSPAAASRKTAVCWRAGGGNNLGCRLVQQPTEGLVGM